MTGFVMPGSSVEVREIHTGCRARLVEHFFRHDYGRLVATLTRRVGLQHLEDVEHAVQGGLIDRRGNVPRAGLPDNPGAWLFRVAYNNVAR